MGVAKPTRLRSALRGGRRSWHDAAVNGAAVVASSLVALFGGATDAADPPARTFTVTETQRSFRAATGLRLVRFRAASTPDVTSLRTAPHRTRRFGNFQLFVLRPGSVQRMRRVFTNGVDPDADGVYWVPDRAGGWIAVQLFERNLVLAWFPSFGRDTDASFRRLSATLHRLAPEVRHRRRP